MLECHFNTTTHHPRCTYAPGAALPSSAQKWGTFLCNYKSPCLETDNPPLPMNLEGDTPPAGKKVYDREGVASRPENLTREFNDMLLRIHLLALVGALPPSAPLLLVLFARPQPRPCPLNSITPFPLGSSSPLSSSCACSFSSLSLLPEHMEACRMTS